MQRYLVLAFLATATACSGGGGSQGPGAFPQTLTSASGALTLVLSAPMTPTVGTDTLELNVTSAADAAPLTGLAIAIVPWMPAMDHGTSVTPTVTAEGGGRYRIDGLYLYMPGLWELRTTFSGPVSDHAEPQFEIQ